MQRAVGTVLVAVLVVLAGCSGVFGGDSGEPTDRFTPAPVPTDEPTPTPVPQLAPGLNQQGIENASALIAAHASFLGNRSFTQKSNTTELAPNGTVRFRSTGTLRAGPPGEGVYSVSETERNGSVGYPNNYSYSVHTEVWANSKRVFVKRVLANGTTVYHRQRAMPRYGTTGAFLRGILKSFGTVNTSVTKRERNGTTLYLVRGNTRSTQSFISGNVSLRLLIDSQGVIHSYRVVRRPPEANASKLIFERRYMKIGTTEAPERPSWVDEATNQTTPIPEETTITNY